MTGYLALLLALLLWGWLIATDCRVDRVREDVEGLTLRCLPGEEMVRDETGRIGCVSAGTEGPE